MNSLEPIATESTSAEIETKFFSTNSFMKLVIDKEKENTIEFIDLYFIPLQTFKNQFNNVSIKPLALLIKLKGTKAKSLKYSEMIEYLGCIPIISFKPNNDRKIYKKQEMQKLIIKNGLKEYQGNSYYESKVITVKDSKVIEKIKADAPQKNSFTTNDEMELFE